MKRHTRLSVESAASIPSGVYEDIFTDDGPQEERNKSVQDVVEGLICLPGSGRLTDVSYHVS